jgi:hypothetical protein
MGAEQCPPQGSPPAEPDNPGRADIVIPRGDPTLNSERTSRSGCFWFRDVREMSMRPLGQTVRLAEARDRGALESGNPNASAP